MHKPRHPNQRIFQVVPEGPGGAKASDAVRFEGMVAREKSRIEVRQRQTQSEKTMTKAAALDVLRPLAEHIEYDWLHHSLRVGHVGTAAKDRKRIGEALVALGSDGYVETDPKLPAGRPGPSHPGMVTAIGSDVNKLVVATEIRAGGIAFEGMHYLPKETKRGRG